jgi:hypothetical protein
MLQLSLRLFREISQAAVVLGFVWGGMGVTAWEAGAAALEASFLVHSNGSVAVSGPADAPWLRGLSFGHGDRFEFALPDRPPKRQWLEEGRLPICHTEYEKDGIRYTQTVLATRLSAGAPMAGGEFTAEAVLLVHIVGENTASEYTEASAAFGLRNGGRDRNLEFGQGLISVIGTNRQTLGAIEVPSTGVAGTNGLRLLFRGSMPPGTTGSMTFKIPLFPCRDDQKWEDVRDLEFGAELRRVKRFWMERFESSGTLPTPVAFAGPSR